MSEGASFALGPSRPRCMGEGPLTLWDHRGPRRMGEVASWALGAPRPPPHG